MVTYLLCSQDEGSSPPLSDPILIVTESSCVRRSCENKHHESDESRLTSDWSICVNTGLWLASMSHGWCLHTEQEEWVTLQIQCGDQKYSVSWIADTVCPAQIRAGRTQIFLMQKNLNSLSLSLTIMVIMQISVQDLNFKCVISLGEMWWQ